MEDKVFGGKEVKEQRGQGVGRVIVGTARIPPGVVFEGNVIQCPQNEEMTSGLQGDCNKEG